MYTVKIEKAAFTIFSLARSLTFSICHRYLFVTVLLIYTSCTKELDLPYPQAEDQIVVNGILHPDSLIQVSVTKTLPVNSFGRGYPLVENAKVQMYEDDKLLGKLAFQDSLYALDYYPKAGSEYHIELEVPGYPLVKASDIVPSETLANICYLSEERVSSFGSPIPIQILMNDPPENNYYWLYSTMTNYRYIPRYER